MKLAEALQVRADLQRKIAQMHSRLANSATVQEGEQPPEDPKQLLEELDTYIEQLEDLICRINVTNCNTVTEQGSLTALIARRDCLKTKIEKYRNFLESASSLTRRSMHTEIKILSTVSVRDLQKKCDLLSKEFRETDTFIQSVNWTTELM